jgi:arylsulfatase A-like enzyme
MRVFPRGLLPRSLLFSLGVTVALGVVPFAAAQRASFLGKDVSSVAAGILGFYPGVAAAEVGRVVLMAMLFWLVVGLVFGKIAERVPGKAKVFVQGVLPLLLYAGWWWGAAVKYPAMFEGFLPEAAQRAIFRLGAEARPSTPTPTSMSTSGSMAAKPNLLLIGVDSLRTDRVGHPEVTPNLRALLEDPQVVTFEDHYVGVPRTFPSWIEMLTGKPSARNGIRHMFPSFGDREAQFEGLITALKDNGYRTEAISDFAGDIFPRFSAGFDRVFAPKLTLVTMIRLSVDQSFPAFLPMMVMGPFRPFFPALKQSPAFGDAEHLADLVERRTARQLGGPWAITTFFSAAHFPYAAPYPYYGMFADKAYDGSFRFQKNPEVGGDQGPTEADKQQTKALYDGAVRSVDDQLGRLFAHLKETGQWESTLIVVTADHGEDLYENGLLQGHGEHLRGENVLKVPFILKLPGTKRPEHRRVKATTRSIDVASTIMGALGQAKPIGDGIDWMNAVNGWSTPAVPAFSETEIWFSRGGPGFFQEKRLDYPGISGLLSFDQGYSGEIVLNPQYEPMIVAAKHRMLIEGDWKIIYMPTSHGIEYELYDRVNDPANLANLAEANPEKLEEMKDRLLEVLEEEEAPRGRLVDDYVVQP